MRKARRTRREFLTATGLASLGSTLAPAGEPARLAPPVDNSRDLKPTGADLGSLFPEVSKLAEANRYASSFSAGTYRTVEEFRTAGRAKIFDLLLYRPKK